MSSDEPELQTFTIAPGAPLNIATPTSAAPREIPTAVRSLRDSAAVALSAYYRALRELNSTGFAAAGELVPPHLSQPLRAYVFCAENVVLVREELAPELDRTEVVAYASPMPPAELALALSEKTVFLRQADVAELGPDDGVQLHVDNGDAILAKFRIHVARDLPEELPAGEAQRLLQITRDIDLNLYGHLVGDAEEPTHEFVIRAPMQLPVGWQRVLAFHRSTAEQWTAASARAWASQDLCAAIFNRQSATTALSQFDPRRAARLAFTQLVDEFQSMLTDSAEEPLHQFLRSHIELLFPASAFARSKVPFGGRVSDFVVRSADGQYTLVELESPARRLFTNEGAPARDLTHAIWQITSWRRYIEDNLRTVQEELELPGLTCAATSLVVIGRAANLSAADRRTLHAMQVENRGLEVLTYDDVVARARALCSNLFGPPVTSSGEVETYVRPYSSS